MKYFLGLFARVFPMLACFLALGSLAVRADEVWTNGDIGVVGATGSSSYNTGTDTFTIQGSGAGFASSSDGGQFVYIPVEGNTEIIAKVTSVSGLNASCLAGLMMRETLNENSKFALVAVTQGNVAKLVARSDELLSSETVSSGSSAAPIWFRLTRSGTTFSAYQSSDGVNWSAPTTKTINFSNKYYIGLTVSSTQPGTLATGVFNKVSLLTNVPQPSANLKLWLRSDVNMAFNGSSEIASWEDQSGNGNTATQSTAASKPTFVVDLLNGKPAARFDGTNDYLDIANSASTQIAGDMTMIAVMGYSNFTNGVPQTFFTKGPNASGSNYLFGKRSVNVLKFSYNDGTLRTIAESSSWQPGSTAPKLIGCVINKTASAKNAQFYVDGVLKSAVTDPNNFAYSATSTVGARIGAGPGPVEYYGGDLLELFLYNKALTDSERQEVEAYIYQKYSIGTMPATLVPTANILGGTYGSAQSVTLGAANGASIYYTLDGNTPTISSFLYTGPISIGSTSTLKAISVKNGFQNSAVASFSYNIDSATSGITHAGLAVWLKADSGVTLNGSTVSQWTDQSGKGNDATQATAGNQPVLTTGALNGKPVVTFDGSTDFLQFGSGFNDFTQGASIVVVAKPTSTANHARFVELGNGTSGDILGMGREGTTSGLKISVYTGTTGAFFSSSSGIVTTNYQILAGTLTGPGAASLYSNGTLLSQGSTGLLNNITRTQNYLGKSGSSGIAFYQGNIAEIFVYNRKLTDDERRDLEAYVYVKYGIGTQPVAAAAPAPSILTGTYGPTTVSFTVPSGYELRYTLNGVDPTSTSSLYGSPIALSSTATLKYRLFRSGYAPGPVGSQSYTIEAGASGVTHNGLVLWLKADSLSGANGSAVSAWADQSGNSVSVSQGTGGSQPSLQTTAVGGKPGVRFDGGNDFFNLSSALPVTNQMTAIAVLKNNGTGTGTIFSDSTNAAGKDFFWKFTPSSIAVRADKNGAPLISSLASTVTGNRILTWVMGASSTIYNNGTLVGTVAQAGSNVNDHPANPSIGRNWEGVFVGQEYLNADVAEILVYNRTLSDEERREIEAYTYAKYGIGTQPVAPAPPSPSVWGGTYATPFSVSFTVPSGFELRYTLDGSVPNSGSSLYTGPISIGAPVGVLGYSLFRSGYSPSSVTYQVYWVDSATSGVSRSGLALWLRADMIFSPGPVSGWADQSGNLTHVFPTGTSGQPTWVASAINGKPALQFDGVDDMFVGTVNPGLTSTQQTIIAVYKNGANTAFPKIVSLPYRVTGYTAPFLSWSLSASGASDGKPLADFASGASTQSISGSGQSVGLNTPTLVETTFDGTQHKFFLNGNLEQTTATTGSILYGDNPLFTVGARGYGAAAGGYFNGSIAEIFIYNRALNNTERLLIEAYLRQKYGVGIPIKAATPLVDVKTGTYAGTQTVTLSSPDGSAIYYSVDGSAPSILYTGPITISATATLKFKASREFYDDSDVTSVLYTIDGNTSGVSRSGLALWLKADSLVGSNGSPVTGWIDQSGNAINVAQTSSTKQPTLVSAAMSGKPAVRFDGTDDFLSANVTPGLTPSQHTLIAVYKNTVNNPQSKILCRAYRQTGWTLPYVAWDLKTGDVEGGRPESWVAVNSTTPSQVNTSTMVPLNTPTLVMAQNDGAKHRIYLNGVLERELDLTQPISYGDGETFCVGGRSTYNNGEYMNGDIAEILFYSRALSNAERLEIEAYLYSKYGVGPSQKGVVLSWAMDESSGSILNDDSGHGRNATLINSPSRVTGKVGAGALNLQSSSQQYAQLNPANASYLNFGSDSFALSAWVKYTTDPTIPFSRILSKGHYGWNAGYFLGFDILPNGSLGLAAGIGSATGATEAERRTNSFLMRTVAGHADGNWHHVVAVFNRSTQEAKLYVDAVAQPITLTPTSGGSVKPDGITGDLSALTHLETRRDDIPLTLGCHYNGSYVESPFNGSVDQVLIYRGILTQQNVTDLYREGGSGLIGHWKFNEGSGTSIADISGTGLNMVLGGNGPTFGSGFEGTALNFDALGDDTAYLPDMPASSVLNFGSGSFSMSAWFKSDYANYGRLISNGNLSWIKGYTLRLTKNISNQPGRLEFDLSSTTGAEPFSSYPTALRLTTLEAFNDNVWHHVAVTVNRVTGKVKMFVDGVAREFDAASSTGTGLVLAPGIASADISAMNDLDATTQERLRFGEYQIGGNPYNGLLDEVKIFNRALSDQEVEKLGDTNTNGLPDWWELDEFGALGAGGGANDNPDNDSLTNLQEYLQGSNPLDPNDPYPPGGPEVPDTTNQVQLKVFTPLLED